MNRQHFFFGTVRFREMLAKNDNGFADTDGTFCYIKTEKNTHKTGKENPPKNKT